MINKFILIICTLFVLQSQLFSQSNLTESQVEELNLLGSKIEGTFQIQMLDTRSKPTFELSLYKDIYDKRKNSENVYYNVNPNMRILILSKKVIESIDFNSIERVIYISSSP